jgi:autotransporter-associated beta strand protein
VSRNLRRNARQGRNQQGRRGRERLNLACESLERRHLLTSYGLTETGSYGFPWSTGDQITSAAVLDANLDGRLDLLVGTAVRGGPGKTFIGFNSGSGSLQFSDMGPNQDVFWGQHFFGDLGPLVGGGTGHPEVVLDAGRLVSFESGNTWRTVGKFDVPGTYSSIGIGDVDGDGRSDLAYFRDPAQIELSKQLANGTFSSNLVTNYGSTGRAFGFRFDQDQHVDLMVLRSNQFPDAGQLYAPLTVELWRGTSTGIFQFDSTLINGVSAQVAGVGDLNGDGRQDLLLRTGNGSVLSVYIQNSDRSLTNVQNVTVSETPSAHDGSYFEALIPLDFTGDGRFDVAVWTWQEGLKLYTSGPDGRLTLAGSHFGVAYPAFMMAGDFNGDGKSELVVPAFNSPQAKIYQVAAVTAPSAPSNVFATAGNAQATLTWTAPSSNGGAAITDYVLQYSSNGGSTWTTVNRPASMATSATVTGLTNGTNYVFRVAAANSAGAGAYSTTSNNVMPLQSVNVPAAPTNLNASAGPSQSSHLSWLAPLTDGGAPITNYLIQYSSDGGASWLTFNRPASTETTATVPALDINIKYLFRVAAVNSAGIGPYSVNTVGASLPTTPGIISGTPGNAQVTLHWSQSFSSGSYVQDYIVEYSSDNGVQWIRFNDGVSYATTAVVTGLDNDRAYLFRVAAINGSGQGPFSVSSLSITPDSEALPFTARQLWTSTSTAGRAVRTGDIDGDGHIDLVMSTSSGAWVFRNNGNATFAAEGIGPVYNIVSDFALADMDSDGDLDIASGTETVSFRSNDGAGGFPANVGSIDSQRNGIAVADFNRDGLLDVVTAKRHTSQTVAFLLHTNLGNGQFATKLVQQVTDSSVGEKAGSAVAVGDFNGDGVMDFVSGMRPGDQKGIWLHLGDGTGHFTTTKISIGPADVLRVADINNDGRVDVIFSDGDISCLANLGSSGFSEPQVMMQGGAYNTFELADINRDGWIDIVPARNVSDSVSVGWHENLGGHGFTPLHVIGGLSRFHTVAVADINKDGWLDIVSLTTTFTRLTAYINGGRSPVPPTPPLGVIASPGETSVGITWRPPFSGGGALVTGFIVEYSADGGQTWAKQNVIGSTVAATTITGLSPGASYVFRVAAVNSAGAGPFSPITDSVTLLAVRPQAPTSVSAIGGDGQVSLVWSAPLTDGGAAIVNYVIEYSGNGGASWSTHIRGQSTERTATVTGLSNAVSYIFRIAAVNGEGMSPFSVNSSAVTPATVPSAPANVVVTAGNAQASVTWTAPSFNGGAAITDCIVQYSSNGGGTWTTFDRSASMASSATVTGLANGTAYVFRVAAVNSAGAGSYSVNSESVTPAAPATAPSAPTNLTATAGNAHASLTWTAPSSIGGSAITDYIVQYSRNRGGSWTTFSWSASTATSALVTGLINGTAYMFRIAAVNSDGVSEFSSPSIAIVPSQAPTDVLLSALTIPENSGDNAVVGTLSTTDPDGGDTFTYTLVAGTGSTDNAAFNISGNQLRATASLDFETNSSYSVRVRSTDQGGLFTEKAFTITVVPGSTIAVGTGQTVADTTVRTGTAQLVKQGVGTLILDLANSHSGGTVVEEGEVVVRHVAALGTGTMVVKPGARLTLDLGTESVLLSGLDIHGGGLVDVGTGRIVLRAGYFDLSTIHGHLAAGHGAGAVRGSTGIASSVATATPSRAVGHALDGDGNLVVGFAAAGDLDMNGLVDLDDVIAFVSGGFYDAGLPAVWSQGDYDYNGIIDLDDVIAFVGGGLYDQGSYLPATSPPAAQSFAVDEPPTDAESLAAAKQGFDPAAAALASLSVEQWATSDTTKKKQTLRVL